jgi:hypothetical protein
MKKNTPFLFLAAAAAFCLAGGSVRAGTLTLDEGNPSYVPPEAFTNNTIVVDTTIGDPGLIHLSGGVTVAPTSGNTAMVEVTGTFSADSGDKFSVAYRFATDLNFTGPVDYTLSGEVSGIPIPDITGTIEPGLHVYEGAAESPTLPIPVPGSFSGTLTLDFTNAGTATPSGAIPGTLDLTVQQLDFQLSANPAAIIPPSEPQNISTRANVGTGDNALIGGIIITGNDSKQVVVRGIGPSLTGAGVTDALADPILELHDSTGAVIATNDNWVDNSEADRTILIDNDLAPGSDLESALVVNPSPGAYTAVVRGVGDTTGVALVEAYDLDNGTTDSQFANISTRGFVGTGEDVMIGGFILGGGGSGLAQIIVRGIGPSLVGFGVTDPLPDPFLELRNADGDVVASNDNWMDDPNMQAVADRGLAPSEPNESAIYEVLPSGAYTAILSGVGDTTGVGLVESYDVDIGVGPAKQ